MYWLPWLEFIGAVIIFPLISAIGFVINALIIIVISRKKNQSEYFKGARIYKFIVLNAIFNMIECFLSSPSIVDIFVHTNSIFCPSFTEIRAVHLFRTKTKYDLIETFKTSYNYYSSILNNNC